MTAKRIPNDLAVAISYRAGRMNAPVVSGTGERHLAQTIIRLARRYGIPLAEDQDLASELSRLNERAEIPEALYEEVAMLLRDNEQ